AGGGPSQGGIGLEHRLFGWAHHRDLEEVVHEPDAVEPHLLGGGYVLFEPVGDGGHPEVDRMPTELHGQVSGPCWRTWCTLSIASLRSANHSSWLSPTRRTHQASASDRDRATPAAIRVSSTRRSRNRRRVITGTLRVVNIACSSPQRAPQEMVLSSVCSA